MRIVFITFEYPPHIEGGAGVVAYNIAKYLVKLGVEVHVICPRIIKNYDYDIRDSIYVHHIDFINKPGLAITSFWISLWKNFKKIERETGEFDIIHENSIGAFSLSKKIIQTPRIMTVHHISPDSVDILKPSLLERIRMIGGEMGILTRYSEKICIQRADEIIAVSNYTKRKIVEYYNIPQERIKVIYNGLEKRNYYFNKRELNDVKQKFRITDKPVILFVGRINDKRKNIGLLFKSFKLVLEKLEAILIVVGSGDKESYRKLIEPIEKNVIFLGYVTDDNLRKLFAISDVYVSSSKLEGFGLTILEAMAAGTPVVAINSGAISEIIKNENQGILVNESVKELSNGILTYLEDRKGAEMMGKKNIEYVKNFSWETSAEKLLKIYKERCNK